jgi:hypothetical protein
VESARLTNDEDLALSALGGRVHMTTGAPPSCCYSDYAEVRRQVRMIYGNGWTSVRAAHQEDFHCHCHLERPVYLQWMSPVVDAAAAGIRARRSVMGLLVVGTMSGRISKGSQAERSCVPTPVLFHL